MLGMDTSDLVIIGAVTVATLLYFLFRSSGASKDTKSGRAKPLANASGITSRDETNGAASSSG
ncbi:hypothetical protein HDU83_009361 [Entophlyctis luteolus]|nr:hypothetical protein HDU83_009361 [Entophlyctis luteolus]